MHQELDALEKRIQTLKIAYDQYFLGIEKLEPAKERDDVNKLINELMGRFVRNTGAKFRRESLKAKFLSYGRYWDRILKQIEDGTYRGHRIKAKLHERERAEKEQPNGNGAEATSPAAAPVAAAPNAPPSGPRPGAGDAVQRIYEQYVAAKRKTNESVDGISKEKLASVLAQQAQALKQKYNCKSVEFRVVVEDGKTKLKAIPKT